VTSPIGEERKCDLSIQSTSTKIHVSWHEGHCELMLLLYRHSLSSREASIPGQTKFLLVLL
jgi:hypothetical protein